MTFASWTSRWPPSASVTSGRQFGLEVAERSGLDREIWGQLVLFDRFYEWTMSFRRTAEANLPGSLESALYFP